MTQDSADLGCPGEDAMAKLDYLALARLAVDMLPEGVVSML